ncbi:MAG TPA: hypothetical protein PKA95_09195 [Thermomicrobiales bacterium]|nr:hypothetical protein [Thermomicrobiales bacterium]
MTRTFLTALAAVTLLLALAPAAALAAPPANDAFANRTVITSLPYSDTIDMTEATSDPTDPVYCGGPDVATVWYEFTAPADLVVTATTEGSNFLAGINVLIGDPSDPANLDFIDCGLPSVGFYASAGATYYLMVTPLDASTAPGTLVLTAEEAPPPVDLTLTLDPTSSVDPKTGTATISGTVTCSAPASVDIFVQLRQRIGRMYINGFGGTFVDCDGTTPFSAVVSGENGLLTAGKTEVSAFAQSCNFFCSFADAQATIRLTGRR